MKINNFFNYVYLLFFQELVQNIKSIDCLINGNNNPVNCLLNNNMVYIPFSFIKNYFEVSILLIFVFYYLK